MVTVPRGNPSVPPPPPPTKPNLRDVLTAAPPPPSTAAAAAAREAAAASAATWCGASSGGGRTGDAAAPSGNSSTSLSSPPRGAPPAATWPALKPGIPASLAVCAAAAPTPPRCRRFSDARSPSWRWRSAPRKTPAASSPDDIGLSSDDGLRTWAAPGPDRRAAATTLPPVLTGGSRPCSAAADVRSANPGTGSSTAAWPAPRNERRGLLESGGAPGTPGGGASCGTRSGGGGDICRRVLLPARCMRRCAAYERGAAGAVGIRADGARLSQPM
eukprot:30546-Chlamydomonas_euryale.AAC.2